MQKFEVMFPQLYFCVGTENSFLRTAAYNCTSYVPSGKAEKKIGHR
jgi:hypothetical protein